MMRNLILEELAFSERVVRSGHEVVPRYRMIGSRRSGRIEGERFCIDLESLSACDVDQVEVVERRATLRWPVHASFYRCDAHGIVAQTEFQV